MHFLWPYTLLAKSTVSRTKANAVETRYNANSLNYSLIHSQAYLERDCALAQVSLRLVPVHFYFRAEFVQKGKRFGAVVLLGAWPDDDSIGH